MFLVIPLVKFLRMLGVDIDVHHENPATFLCHVSVSSVKGSGYRFASSRWRPVLNVSSRGDDRAWPRRVLAEFRVQRRRVVASRNQTTWRLLRAPPDSHHGLAPLIALPASEPGREIVNPVIPSKLQGLQERVLRDQHFVRAGTLDVKKVAGEEISEAGVVDR